MQMNRAEKTYERICREAERAMNCMCVLGVGVEIYELSPPDFVPVVVAECVSQSTSEMPAGRPGSCVA